MKLLVSLTTVLCLQLCVAPPGIAQQMFLDTNGDGVNTPADRLRVAGATKVDLWVETNRNRDGSGIAGQGSEPTINSYEFVLRAEGGAVEWGEYTNLQPSMDLQLGPRKNATDYYRGQLGMETLPPGRYKLGSLVITVKSGSPRVAFASSSSLWGSARTSFGSQREGKDGDNTLKFTEDPKNIASRAQGDWGDASGVATLESSAGMAHTIESETPNAFSVSLSPNPANPEATLEVRTTKAGFIRVLIFDLSGRLVRTALAEALAPAGTRVVQVPGARRGRAMPSGVYLYRVETTERTVEGKLLIVK
jgi:hypothetical protein